MATLIETFSDIADAIRAKGVSGTFKPIEMASKISEIQTGGSVEPTNDRAVFAHDTARSLVVPKMLVVDFSSVTNLGNCFYECTSMKSLTLPAGFGQNATSLYRCFFKCGALTSLTLPAGFGQNAENIEKCFHECTSIKSLTLPAGFGQNATHIASCFDWCSQLTDITGNPNFKVSLKLQHCTNLTHDSIMVVINGLQTVTSTQTLTLGSTNLAKLTEADKQIATDKGWTLA